MITRRRPFKGPGLILALGFLVPAVWAGEGSIVRIGPCVNPDCNVTPPNSGFKGVATGNHHGVRDALDCSPDNTSAFAVPREVRNDRFPGATLLAWSSERPRSGSGTRYDVLRGDLSELPVGSGPRAACLADGTGAETMTEPAVPAAGQGPYYLVRSHI